MCVLNLILRTTPVLSTSLNNSAHPLVRFKDCNMPNKGQQWFFNPVLKVVYNGATGGCLNYNGVVFYMGGCSTAKQLVYSIANSYVHDAADISNVMLRTTQSASEQMRLSKDTLYDKDINDDYGIGASRLEDIQVLLPANLNDVNQYWSPEFLVGSPTDLCLTYKGSGVIRKSL